MTEEARAPSGVRAAAAVIVVAFAVSACFHVVAIFVPDLGEPSPAWRHASFIAINGALAIGFAVGAKNGALPRWAIVPLALFGAQQLASHGIDLALAAEQNRLDWASVLVLIALPIIALVAARLIRRR